MAKLPETEVFRHTCRLEISQPDWENWNSSRTLTITPERQPSVVVVVFPLQQQLLIASLYQWEIMERLENLEREMSLSTQSVHCSLTVTIPSPFLTTFQGVEISRQSLQGVSSRFRALIPTPAT